MFAAILMVRRAQLRGYFHSNRGTSLSKHFTFLKVMAKVFQKLIIVEIIYYDHMFEVN